MGASFSPASGRRRAVDATINLVPFIDLLSCCIAFLLITAVWSQLGRLPVAPPGAAGDGGERVWTVHLTRDGCTLDRDGASVEIALGDDGGRRALSAAVAARPHGSAVALRVDDEVRYARIIATMDLLRAVGFSEISVDS